MKLFQKKAVEATATVADRSKEIEDKVLAITGQLSADLGDAIDKMSLVQDAVIKGAESIDGIAGSAEDTAVAITKQAEMTNQIQVRLENVNAVSEETKSVADGLSVTIKTGIRLSDELEDQANDVDGNIKMISESIGELVKNVARVADITGTILNISSQTNLLALNASIEAARAGEAGKGFAVVADEIRKLAEETRKSTEEISSIAEQLNNVTSATKTSLQMSVDSIATQRVKIKEVNASFDEVGASMQTLASDIQSISDDLGAIYEENKEIVDSISVLSAASQEAASSAVLSKESMDEVVNDLEEFGGIIIGSFDVLSEIEDAVKSE